MGLSSNRRALQFSGADFYRERDAKRQRERRERREDLQLAIEAGVKAALAGAGEKREDLDRVVEAAVEAALAKQ